MRAQESLPEDEPLLQLAATRIDELNEKYAWSGGPAAARHLLPLPSSAALEPAGTHLDGLRAQARQAGRLERAAARAAVSEGVFAGRRRHRGPVRRQVRHHPGHGHAAAARCGAAIRRRHGAPAESPRLRRSETTGHRGLRHPATARGDQPAGHESLALSPVCTAASRASIRIRAPSRMSIRTCSAKARSSARGSTTSMPSSRRWADASPRTASSATTCSKAATRAPGC